VLYLYAIVGVGELPDGLIGLRGAAVRQVPHNGLTAIVSEHADVDAAGGEEAVLAHARVAERVAGDGRAVLPARFGRVYADEPSLTRALDERRGALEQALAAVSGCVELGLRAIASDDAGAPAAAAAAPSGGAYMRALLEREHASARLADAIHRPLAGLARRSERGTAETSRLVFSAAYLVPTDGVEAFRSTLAEIQDDHPELTLVCTGPWPPYSFASIEAPAEDAG
jgi:Gas vesicle synthesis protein GvpL/GvpF